MANPTPWKSTVRVVNDGEAVKGAVTNRPTNDLSQQTRYLKEILDQMLAGRALILHDQPLAAAMNVGSPLYLDDDGVWKPAIAELESDSYDVPVPLSKRSLALGVLYQKSLDTLGSVILYGNCLVGSEFINVVDGAFAAGIFYLSTSTAGKIVSTMPYIGLPILTAKGPDASGNYNLFVHPVPRSQVTDHVHYHLKLKPWPAGLSNCVPWYSGPYWGESEPGGPYPGIVHEVVVPDETAAGWLPADHPLFAGLEKPDGALFGYNIQADAALRRVWVGTLTSSAYIEVNGQGASDALVIVNDYGIWWMDNEYNHAPWSPNFRPCTGSSSSSALPSSSSSSSTPVDLGPDIDLWLTRMVFQTGDMQVSSLRPADNTMVVTDLDGLTAYTGHLKIRANFNVSTAEDVTGFDVLKSFDPTLLRFTHGPVVGGIKSLSPSVELSGGTQGTDGFWRGQVSLAFNDPNVSRDGEVQLIALNNVKEEVVSDVLYLGFPETIESKIRCKVQLNAFALQAGTTLQMKVVVWFLARAAGSLPAFTMSYRRIPAPTAVCSPLELPTTDTALAFAAECAEALTAGEYVSRESEPFTVEPGDLVYFTLMRPEGTSGDVGLLSVKYHLDVV